jgi:hypothetical protein
MKRNIFQLLILKLRRDTTVELPECTQAMLQLRCQIIYIGPLAIAVLENQIQANVAAVAAKVIGELPRHL